MLLRLAVALDHYPSPSALQRGWYSYRLSFQFGVLLATSLEILGFAPCKRPAHQPRNPVRVQLSADWRCHLVVQIA